MNSHRHIKFVLSWERFLLAFVTGRPFPKMLVKMCAFERRRNVQKKIFVLTEYGPEIGFLTSEGYSYSYPRNTDYISPAYPIPEGWYMNIYFQDFDVEESKHCL